ncbi:hypothetical protein, partial [Lacticaseibacillus manihotivorans]|uniref:hypothetical protein n=1 Tax=Lacticaseibacillus manihotivorans TaxID=88233 RepID=UPI001F2A85AD
FASRCRATEWLTCSCNLRIEIFYDRWRLMLENHTNNQLQKLVDEISEMKGKGDFSKYIDEIYFPNYKPGLFIEFQKSSAIP